MALSLIWRYHRTDTGVIHTLSNWSQLVRLNWHSTVVSNACLLQRFYGEWQAAELTNDGISGSNIVTRFKENRRQAPAHFWTRGKLFACSRRASKVVKVCRYSSLSHFAGFAQLIKATVKVLLLLTKELVLLFLTREAIVLDPLIAENRFPWKRSFGANTSELTLCTFCYWAEKFCFLERVLVLEFRYDCWSNL